MHEAIGRLQRLAELFQQRRAQLAQGAGLTEAQWEVLERIASEHFMPSLFARHRESSAPAVSRIIRQLLRKKLVTRLGLGHRRPPAPLPADRQGQSARWTRCAHARRRAIDAVWMDLDPRALAAFTTFSGELIARLEAYAARARQRPEENP